MNWDLLAYYLHQTIPYVCMLVCYLFLAKKVADIEKQVNASITVIKNLIEVLVQRAEKK